MLEEVLVEVLGALEQRRRQKSRVGAVEWCDGEGVPEKGLFIGQNGQGQMTYLFTVSVKSEGTQVDMVTVRTVIKRLRT